MPKYTLDDVDRVAQAIKSARDRGRSFAFLIGAGVSKAADIPLAGELIDLVANKHPAEFAKIPEADRKNYGRVMGRLSLGERRDLLKPIMDKAKINWANIAIAAILKAGYIDRVLTLNFDNVLERASGICGYYPAVYDFGTAPSNSVDHVVSGSIIHLHGQSYGLVMLNTDEETRRHSDAIRPLVHDTLRSHGLLVIGYSGGADSLFPVIEECHSGWERVYWLGYSEEPAEQIRRLLEKPYTEFLGGADADVFLVELAKQLSCWPPSVLIRPYEHLRDEVSDVVAYPKAFSGDSDLVSDLRQQLNDWEGYRKPRERIDRLRELLLQGNYERVSNEGDRSDSEQADIMAWAKVEEGNEFARNSADDNSLSEAVERYRQALSIKPGMPEALSNWGATLVDLAQLRNDPKLLRESLDLFSSALDGDPDNSGALSNWGSALYNLARMERSQELFHKSFEKFARSLSINTENYLALYNWGNALFAFARINKDENLMNESIAKYKQVIKINPSHHEAYNNCGNAIAWLATKNKDEERFLESIDYYKKAIDIKPNKNETLNNWGNSLLSMAKINPSEKILFDACDKYEQSLSINPDAREPLGNWGHALVELWHLTKDERFKKLAYEKYLRAEHVLGKPTYNMACLLAIQGDEEAAKRHLAACKAAGTLPVADRLYMDLEWAAYLEKPWFVELLRNI